MSAKFPQVVGVVVRKNGQSTFIMDIGMGLPGPTDRYHETIPVLCQLHLYDGATEQDEQAEKKLEVVA